MPFAKNPRKLLEPVDRRRKSDPLRDRQRGDQAVVVFDALPEPVAPPVIELDRCPYIVEWLDDRRQSNIERLLPEHGKSERVDGLDCEAVEAVYHYAKPLPGSRVRLICKPRLQR